MAEFKIEKTEDEGSLVSMDIRYKIGDCWKKVKIQFNKEEIASGEWKERLKRFLEREEEQSKVKVDLSNLVGKKLKPEDL